MCRPDPQPGSALDGQLQGWRFKAASRRPILRGRRRGSGLTRIFTLLLPTPDPFPRSRHAAKGKIGRERENNEGDIMRLLQIVLQRPSQRSGGVAWRWEGPSGAEFWPTSALSGAARSSEHLWRRLDRHKCHAARENIKLPRRNSRLF